MNSSAVLAFLAFVAALHLVSSAEPVKCYVCNSCDNKVGDEILAECRRGFNACGKFVTDDTVIRTCITEQTKNEYNGKCDVHLPYFVPGATADVVGCAYGCTGNGCNSAPSAMMPGQLVFWLGSLLLALSSAIGM